MLPLERQQFPETKSGERNRCEQDFDLIGNRTDDRANLHRRPDRLFFLRQGSDINRCSQSSECRVTGSGLTVE